MKQVLPISRNYGDKRVVFAVFSRHAEKMQIIEDFDIGVLIQIVGFIVMK
jgi:hypothetical protein